MEHDILVTRGLRETAINVSRGSWSIQNLTSEVNENIVSVIDSVEVASKDDFLKLVDSLLKQSESLPIFANYLSQLTIRYPEYANLIDYEAFDANFNWDARLLGGLNLFKFLALNLYATATEKVDIPMFVLLVGLMINALNNGFKTNHINQHWSNTDLFNKVLEADGVSDLAKYKVKKFLGYDMINQSNFEMIDQIYRPEIELDYEFLISHSFFDYYRFGQRLVNKKNNYLDCYLILFEELLKSHEMTEKLVSQLKIVVNYYIKQDPSIFADADILNLKLLVFHAPDLLDVVCKFLSRSAIEMLFYESSLGIYYAQNFSFLASDARGDFINIDLSSADTVSEKLYVFYDLIHSILPRFFFKDVFFNDGFDFSEIKSYERDSLVKEVLYRGFDWYRLYIELLPCMSNSFALFFSEIYNKAYENTSFYNVESRVSVFDLKADNYFGEFNLNDESFRSDLDSILESYEDKSLFLNDLEGCIYVNKYYFSQKSVGELFSERVLEFLNESKFWLRFDEGFWLQMPSGVSQDNLYLSLQQAYSTGKIVDLTVLDSSFAYSKFGYVYLNNKAVCDAGSFEFSYALKKLLRSINTFEELSRFVFDFTSQDFLEVLNDKDICRKVITLLSNLTDDMDVRINMYLIVSKAISVLGRDGYYQLLESFGVFDNEALLDVDLFKSSSFLSVNELLVLRRIDTLAFGEYFNYVNLNVHLSDMQTLEILSSLLLSYQNVVKMPDVKVSLDVFKSFVASQFFDSDHGMQSVLFDYLYMNNCFLYESENDLYDFFNDVNNQYVLMHQYIDKAYDFFESSALDSYESKWQTILNVYKFKLDMTADKYNNYFLYLIDSHRSGLDHAVTLSQVGIDDIDRILQNLGVYFLIRFLHLLPQEMRNYVISNAKIGPVDKCVARIDSGRLLESDRFWMNVSLFSDVIQHCFFQQVAHEKLDIFENQNILMKRSYLQFLKLYLNSNFENSFRDFYLMPRIDVAGIDVLGAEMLSLEDFYKFSSCENFSDLFESNQHITNLFVYLLEVDEFDTDLLKKQFRFFIEKLLVVDTDILRVLDVFLEAYDEDFLWIVVTQLKSLDVSKLRLFVSRLAQVKYRELISANNPDACRRFVAEKFDGDILMQYMLSEEDAVILKNLNLILEHIDLRIFGLSESVLKSLEFNQVDVKYYNLLFEMFKRGHISKSFTYEFVTEIMKSRYLESRSGVFQTLLLLNKQDSSVFIEYMLRNDRFDLMSVFGGSKVTGRGLKRLIGINSSIDRVYRSLGELDLIVIKLVLYLENKIELDPSIEQYLDDIKDLEDLFAAIDAVNLSIVNPKQQPVLDTKIARYLFAVVNGFFRVHYSFGMDLESLYENFYEISASMLETNPAMTDLVFDVDYYSQVQGFILPQSTVDYVKWLQTGDFVTADNPLDIDKLHTDSIESQFDLITVPSEYKLVNFYHKILEHGGLVNLLSICETKKESISKVLSELNGVTIDLNSVTKKQLKKLKPLEKQLHEFIENYPALIVSALVHNLYCKKRGVGVLDAFLNSLPQSEVSDINWEVLSQLSFADLKATVYESQMSRSVIGWVSTYKKIKKGNVFDYSELVKDEILEVMFALVPHMFRIQLMNFDTDAGFVEWNNLSESALGIYRDYFAKLTSDSKRQSVIKKIMGLSALEDITEPKRSGLETRQLMAHNTRNLFMEFSGYNVDACWANTYDYGIASTVTNVSFYKFSELDVDSGLIIQRGGTLILEGESESGDLLWLVRGLNPRNDMYPNFCAESFVSSFLESLMDRALEVNASVCVILDAAHASSTNRRWVRRQYDNLDLEKVVPRERSEFVFNQYLLTPDNMYLVLPSSFSR